MLINKMMMGAAGVSGGFIAATGGTVTEDGDYKIHTFLLDDSGDDFEITALGSDVTYGSKVEYLVVAGGGGGGNSAYGRGHWVYL